MTVTKKLPSLRGHILFLSIAQTFNYIIPLILIPYLTRVLGAESFGKVVFAQTITTYVLLIIDYGFSWSATREIATNKNNHAHVSRVFVTTWAAQWLLFVTACLILTIIVSMSEKLMSDALLYSVAMMSVIGSLMLPVWYLQGMERHKAIALIQLTIKLAALMPIFFLVTEPAHSVLFLFINGIVSILGGLIVIYWIHRQKMITWYRPNKKQIFIVLSSGWTLFASRISISIYTNLVPLVLGWLAGPVALAYFNIADRLRNAAQSLIGPLAQTLYPRMNYLLATDSAAALRLLKLSFVVVVLVAGSAGLCLWYLSEWLVILIAGQEFLPAAKILKWLAALPLIVGLSNLLGVQVMLVKNMNKAFNWILILAAGIGLALVWPLILHSGAQGAAKTLLMVETFVTSTMAIYLWRTGTLKTSNW